MQDLCDINLSIDYIPSANFRAALILDWCSYENLDHISGNNETDFKVSLRLSANIDYRDYGKFSWKLFLP